MQQGGEEHLGEFFVSVLELFCLFCGFPFLNKLLRQGARLIFKLLTTLSFSSWSIHSSELQWELCMPPGQLCKPARWQWLVSLSLTPSSLQRDAPVPSPGLFTVPHPRGADCGWQHTQWGKGSPATELSCANSLETCSSLSPGFSLPAEQNHCPFLFSLGALGFPVLLPVPAPPSSSFQTTSAEKAEPAPDFPTSYQPCSLAFDRNVKLHQLAVQGGQMQHPEAPQWLSEPCDTWC